MDDRARKAMQTNRRIVQDRINRCQQEKRLNDFEDAMIRGVNDNYAVAALRREMDAEKQNARVGLEDQIHSRAKKNAKARQRRKNAALSCSIFFNFVALFVLLWEWEYITSLDMALCVTYGIFVLALYTLGLYGILPVWDKK